MNRDEREALQAARAQVQDWVDRAKSTQEYRAADRAAWTEAIGQWAARTRRVDRDESPAWVVIPYGPADVELLRPVIRWHAWRSLSKPESQTLAWLQGPVLEALRTSARASGVRRLLSSKTTKDAVAEAAAFLDQALRWGSSGEGAARLAAISTPPPPLDDRRLSTASILNPQLGLLAALQAEGEPEYLEGEAFGQLAAALKTINAAVAAEEPQRRAVLAAAQQVQEADVRAFLADLPLRALKEATGERLRFGPLEGAGLATVLDVLTAGSGLTRIPGVGERTVTGIRAAAQTLWRTTLEDMPVRIDILKRPEHTTVLLRALITWEATRRTRGAADDLKRARELAPLAGVQHQDLLVLSQPARSAQMLLDSVTAVVARAQLLRQAQGGRGAAATDPWTEFMARAADMYALLAELGLSVEDDQAAEGDLPAEIVEAIRNQELRTDLLEASLRGYQAFAARFVLVQRKVVIGDEMGLGKTVEALAVLAHLRVKGAQHFLVVCPASVVTNWTREVAQKSRLRAERLHGPDRLRAYRAWHKNGGVGVTTYEGLAWLTGQELPDLACVIVDEAHYVKNPEAQRSRRCLNVINAADRAVLLTGTPLENRVEEFRTLVRYVRPDLIVDGSELAPRRFRKQVAPAYLRRNQEDVLSELPALVEVSEWLGMSAADELDYREAVLASNFMAMRKAAMLGPKSAKFERLRELVEEAEDNGRRVIVFSYFLDVLQRVCDELPGPVFGPLNGSVAPARRQEMVDRFSAAQDGAVLAAQVVAGGVGLNIQAASVVIICEPQIKPTLEAQAIARAHRMGQINNVQVHRLLTETSVDERIVEILARKQALFDEFARTSDTAESTPEALDITEAQLARQVVEAERLRILGALG